MINRLILLLGFVLLWTYSNAQNLSFDTGTKWSEASYSFYDGTSGSPYTNTGWYYQIEGDTLIVAINYKLVRKVNTWSETKVGANAVAVSNISTDVGYIGAIREDIPQKKIYYYSFVDYVSECSNGDTVFFAGTEQLIYDFDLTIGDTVAWSKPLRVVHHIDSQLLDNGLMYKAIHFDAQPNFDYWIEGLGSNIGLFGAYFEPPFEAGCRSNCVFKNNAYILGTDSSNCDSTTAVVNPNAIFSVAKQTIDIQIYPNPVQSKLFVKVSSFIPNDCWISIYNQLGQKVYQKELRESTIEIDAKKIGGIGIYFVQIQQKNKTIATDKFIVSE